jgi:hypothetical protein
MAKTEWFPAENQTITMIALQPQKEKGKKINRQENKLCNINN